jgi:hypothetical protein
MTETRTRTNRPRSVLHLQSQAIQGHDDSTDEQARMSAEGAVPARIESLVLRSDKQVVKPISLDIIGETFLRILTTPPSEFCNGKCDTRQMQPTVCETRSGQAEHIVSKQAPHQRNFAATRLPSAPDLRLDMAACMARFVRGDIGWKTAIVACNS